MSRLVFGKSLIVLGVVAALAAGCGDGDAGSGTDSGTEESPDGGPTFAPIAPYDSECGGAEETPECLYFVDVDALGDGGVSGDGLSWEDAFGTVQEGVDAAHAAFLDEGDADSKCHVWVAEGTYFPTADETGETAPADPQTKTISLKEGVSLFGGFAGDELACDERDLVAHETILSGDLGATDDKSDNAYHMLTGADFAVLDGFTIRNGRISMLSAQVVADAFGGMLNVGVSPTVAHCTFINNGGEDDMSSWGGAMRNTDGASPLVCWSVFRDNIGAVVNLGESSRPVIYGCLFEDNSAGTCPGDVCAGGGAIANFSGATSLIVSSRFIGNSGDHGGAIEDNESSSAIINCLFVDNTAYGWGGGGAVSVIDASSEIVDCTFVDNVYVEDGPAATISVAGASSPRIINSVLSGGPNQIDVGYAEGASGTPDCAAYATDIYWTGDGLACSGTGGLEVDPLLDALFVPSEGSPCIDTGVSELLPNDMLDLDGDGDTAEPFPYDIDGNPRIVGSGVDMGAFELQ